MTRVGALWVRADSLGDTHRSCYGWDAGRRGANTSDTRDTRDIRDIRDECLKRVGRSRRPQGRKKADHLCPSKAKAAVMGTRERWVGTAKRMRADGGAAEAT